MVRRLNVAWMVALLMATLALPVGAAQGGVGGVHFGPYELSAGDSLTGDLVVFGPVSLEKESQLDGDLAAFGGVTLKEDATVTGDLVVFGALEIAGTVEGNVFSAGEVHLQETAVVEGNLAAAGMIDQEEGSTVEGSIEAVEDMEDFEWDVPFVAPEAPVHFDVPPARPAWVEALWNIGRAILTVLVLTLFALLIASIWPKEMTRVGSVIVDAPLPSFGIGLLALFLSTVVIVILAVTICLSPIALIGAVVAGVGIALGWVALGSVLGERILRGLFNSTTVTPASSAIVGTIVITLMAVLVNLVSDCLYTILILPFFALVTGAVTLTRFGTMPYAAHGGGVPHHSTPPVAPSVPLRPAVEPVDLEEKEDEVSGDDDEGIPSPDGEPGA